MYSSDLAKHHHLIESSSSRGQLAPTATSESSVILHAPLSLRTARQGVPELSCKASKQIVAMQKTEKHMSCVVGVGVVVVESVGVIDTFNIIML